MCFDLGQGAIPVFVAYLFVTIRLFVSTPGKTCTSGDSCIRGQTCIRGNSCIRGISSFVANSSDFDVNRLLNNKSISILLFLILSNIVAD